MSSTLTIPAAAIPRLREGAHLQLAHAAETIQREAQHLEKDTPPLDARAESDRAWALLDMLGWAGPLPESVHADLREHATALLASVAESVTHLTEVVGELREGDPIRTQRARELHELRAFEADLRQAIALDRHASTSPGTLLVPPVLLRRIREGAFGLLVRASAAIEDAATACVQPEPDSRPRLERAWSLLDAIGWSDADDTGAIVELSVSEHGGTLLAAIEDVLPLVEGWFDELPASDPQRAERADELRLMRQLAAQVHCAVGEGSSE